MSLALAKIVKRGKLEKLIELLNFEYAILQSIPQIHIGRFEELKRELGEGMNARNFDSGRLFSEDLEIRWRKKGKDEFYTLVISDNEQTLDGYERRELEITNRHSFYLWGEKEKTGGMWYELRIPKGWRYPAIGRYAKIKVIEYEVRGIPDEGGFYRFSGFEGANK